LDEEEQNLLYDLHLITQKPVVYVCNVDEDHATTDNDYVKTVRRHRCGGTRRGGGDLRQDGSGDRRAG
jgi:ribosome-binding ATPase YchF (GTP1/OBG family)